MAKDLAEQLARIGRKAELLTTRYRLLEQELVRQRARVAELESELDAERRQSERIRLDNEHLRISAAIAPDTDKVAKARAYISDLVREIDACVDDLMRDI